MNLATFSGAPFAPAHLDSLSVGSLISRFSIYYPNIDQWFSSKVLTGTSNGTRKIIVRESAGVIHGIAILKKDEDEHKICTLWIRPDQRGFGLGEDLLAESIDWLGCSRPLLTVPAEALHQFIPLVSKHGFNLSQRADGYYRANRCEYVFNGRLPEQLSHTVS